MENNVNVKVENQRNINKNVFKTKKIIRKNKKFFNIIISNKFKRKNIYKILVFKVY
jgi:hypothetical protein